MIKALVNPSTYTSGSIPLTLAFNTNTKYLMQNNAIDVMTSGVTEVKANVTITATSVGSITLTALANGSPIAGASATIMTADEGTYTLHINDVVRTAYLPTSGFVGLTFELSSGCTLVGGDVICEYVCA